MNISCFTISVAISVILAAGPVSSDTIVIEGDLETNAAGGSNGDLNVDNELTVNADSITPDTKSSLRVTSSGVIWAGEANAIYDGEPEEGGMYLTWNPAKASLQIVADPLGTDYYPTYLGTGSVAFGKSTQAGNSYAMSWGEGEINANYATAWGYGYAGGKYSTVWGGDPNDGYPNNGWGDWSTTWGINNDVGGRNNTVWGLVNIAWTAGTGADGPDGIVSEATVWGAGNMVAADYGTVWGITSTVEGIGGTAWGRGSQAISIYSTVLGSYNERIHTNWEGHIWNELDSVLEVGIGVDSQNRLNALSILKNGKTTLTNKAWKAELEGADPLGDPIDMTNSSGGNALVVEGHAVVKGKLTLVEAQGDISMGIYGN